MDEAKAKEFVEAYNKLCAEMGFRLAAAPMLLPTNHGTYEVGVQLQVVENPPPTA
jgi:hypothetical protein